MEAHLYNGLALAYIGDAVYEVAVRRHMMNLGLTKVDQMHKQAIKYTSGEAQAKIIRYFKESNILTEDEMDYYKRGRNSTVSKVRKNIKRSDYLDGTGFEALIGFLHLTGNNERVDYLINLALLFVDNDNKSS